MQNRVQELRELTKLLDEGRIDRFEFEALKEELLAHRGEKLNNSHDAPPVSDLHVQAFERIDSLKHRTLQTFGWGDGSLANSEGGAILLKGIEAFVKGVKAFSMKALGSGSDLTSLIQMKPEFMPMAIYMGVTGAINDIASRYPNEASPYEFRGFMAAFATIAFQELAEAGIPFDPGRQNQPAEIFVRLGVAGEGESHTETRDTEAAKGEGRQEQVVPSLESVVAQVHQRMGLQGLPISVGTRAVHALEDMVAAGLLQRSDSVDGFKLVVGNLSRGLTAPQKRLLGYSWLNTYPATAVTYLKEIMTSAVAAGTLDYSPELIGVIRSKPSGT